ncbi:MAG: outer membrane beta-barrel protein [Bacteroidales bacterium]
MKRYILLILFFSSIIFLQAQTTCTDILKQAERNFDEGKLDEIPQAIESCMKSGFTSEEKMKAYKLLIQTYLFNEKLDLADQVMIRFLREFPSYEIVSNDPKEFINLYKTYRTEPIFKMDVFAGLNYSMPQVTEFYSPGNLNQNSISYKSMVSFTAGVNYTDRLYKDFDFSVGVNFSMYKMDYTDNQYTFTSVTGTFSNMYLGIPLAVKYNWNYKGLKVIARVGVETSYLLSSKMDFSKSFTNGDNPIKSSEDLLACYKKFDLKPFISIGFPLKVDKYELIPSIGIKFSTIKPLQNELKDPLESGNYYMYNYAPDNMYMNQVFFTLSFMKPIYNPKKIK